MTAPLDPSWEHLPNPRTGENVTPVYLRVLKSTPLVVTAADGLRHLYGLPGPLRLKLISAVGNSLQYELCRSPQIVAGYSPPTLGNPKADAESIVAVLVANGLNVQLPA